MNLYAFSFLLALVLSLAVTPAVRAVARWARVLDVPDGKRKRHLTSVPRLGGVAVFVSFYVCFWLIVTQLESPTAQSSFRLVSSMFAPSLLILALGIADDKWSVSPWAKIAVQIVAGLIVYYDLGIRIDTLTTLFTGDSLWLSMLSLPATLFWIVLITNAFNVVDGMDGLATGVAFIALACMFMVSLQMNQTTIAFAAAPLAGAVLGFLRYNFNPASIFLGDSGSLFLGFQLAVLSIVGSQKSSTAVAVTAPIFVLALPLIETATSAFRRFVSGRSIMKPDAGHIHHQLLRLGCTPRRAAGILYLSSGVFGLASLFVVQGGTPKVGLLAVSFFAVTVFAIQRLGYTEFAEINGALRRFVYQRQIIQNGIVCRKLATDLASVSSIQDAWAILRTAARRLGFSYVELTLHPRAADEATAHRYAERLMPRPGSAQPPETTFAVALRGSTSGQVVFSRSAAAPPLHSELPLLISAVAESLPHAIDRGLKTAPPRPAPEPRLPIDRPAASEAARKTFDWNRNRMRCVSCDSFALHRSRSRSFVEHARKRLTRRRLFECATCGWRGWIMPNSVSTHGSTIGRHADAPDLRGLDEALQNVRHTITAIVKPRSTSPQ